MFQGVREACEEDLAFFDKRVDDTVLKNLAHVIETPFQRVTYGDAIEVLRTSGQAFEYPVGTEHLSNGTASYVSSWPPDDDRRRVLVEVAGGRWAGEAQAT